MLIPTTKKDKISGTLSWLIGAEKVSEHIKDFNEVSLTNLKFLEFYNHHLKIVLDRNYVPCFRVRYLPADGEYKWEIVVYATLKNLKHEVQGAIEKEGLEILSSWLVKKRSQVWCPMNTRLRFFTTF